MSDRHLIPNPPSVKDIEAQLLEKNPKIFDGVSNTKKNKILNSLKDYIGVEVRQEITQFMSFSGPVPPPDILREYININPDFAQTIIQMSIDEQRYAHSRDNKIIEKSFESKKRGQNYALVIALVAIIGGIICILLDHEIAGGVVSGVGLTGLISEFLGRSRSSKSSGVEEK